MKTKNIFLYLPLLLALMLGAMGCSSDDDSMENKGCFSAYVMGVNSDGTVMAQITEAPEGLSNAHTGQPLYSNSDIVCEDADGDGYYFWGIGTRPSSCPPSAPTDPDGDDSDPTVGPMDEYGNLTTLTNEIVISSLVNYSSVMNFTHNIRIVNGGHLRITNTTTLRNAAQITVENGGLLTIDGGTLNNAKIVFYSGATLNVINGGTINMAKNQDFNAPVGVVVNITEGQVNNF